MQHCHTKEYTLIWIVEIVVIQARARFFPFIGILYENWMCNHDKMCLPKMDDIFVIWNVLLKLNNAHEMYYNGISQTGIFLSQHSTPNKYYSFINHIIFWLRSTLISSTLKFPSHKFVYYPFSQPVSQYEWVQQGINMNNVRFLFLLMRWCIPMKWFHVDQVNLAFHEKLFLDYEPEKNKN